MINVSNCWRKKWVTFGEEEEEDEGEEEEEKENNLVGDTLNEKHVWL